MRVREDSNTIIISMSSNLVMYQDWTKKRPQGKTKNPATSVILTRSHQTSQSGGASKTRCWKQCQLFSTVSNDNNSSSVETLPTIFITSLGSTHWRRSAKKRSRSSRTNCTIALNSSRSERDSMACWMVGLGSDVILFEWTEFLGQSHFGVFNCFLHNCFWNRLLVRNYVILH